MSREDKRLTQRVEDQDDRAHRAAVTDEVRQDRELTDDDRVEMMRESFMQARLPNIPPIPGYHTCWLSTQNSGDTIMSRVRLGYEPVKPEDVPYEMRALFVGSGDTAAALLTVNEMVAYKINERLWRRFMAYNHHERPAEDEAGIVGKLDELKEEWLDRGGRIQEGEGMQRLRKQPPAPKTQKEWETGYDPVAAQAAILRGGAR